MGRKFLSSRNCKLATGPKTVTGGLALPTLALDTMAYLLAT